MNIVFDEITTLITNVGFPIGVCIYLLVSFEKKIDSLNQNIAELTKVITTVIGNQKK